MSASPASDDYFEATYRVLKSEGACEQIRKVLLHLDSMPVDDIPEDNKELLQYWVNLVLDNQIENDHERLWEIGEQG